MIIKKKRTESRPKIFWRNKKTVICKHIKDGKYQLCIDRNNDLYYTGIISKDINEVIKIAEEEYGDE